MGFDSQESPGNHFRPLRFLATSSGVQAPSKHNHAIQPPTDMKHEYPIELRILRIAVFLSGLSGGGAQRRSLLLARGFVERGCAVDIVVVRGEGPFRAAVPAGARLFALEPYAARLPVIRNFKGLWVVSGLFALARYLAVERPHVLLSTSVPANLTALWGRVLSQTRTPIVITANLNLTMATAKWGAFVAKLLRWLISHAYNSAQAVIAISRGVAEDLVAVTGIPEVRIFQIYNPLDLELVARLSREAVDHPWLATGAPPIVLAVGKLKLQKDYPTLVRAFAHVRANREAHLVILGEGEERERIERLVRDSWHRSRCLYARLRREPLRVDGACFGLRACVCLGGFQQRIARGACLRLHSRKHGLPKRSARNSRRRQIRLSGSGWKRCSASRYDLSSIIGTITA